MTLKSIVFDKLDEGLSLQEMLRTPSITRAFLTDGVTVYFLCVPTALGVSFDAYLGIQNLWCATITRGKLPLHTIRAS